MVTILRQAKICRPAQIVHGIRRRRLLDALHRGLRLRLTVVSAPAGCGKTTLLRQFVDELPSPSAWVTVDPSDRDPMVLLADIQTALGLPEDARRPQPFFGWRDFAHNLCYALDRIGDAAVIALDDFHELDGAPEIDSVLGYLLSNLPDQVRVILSSRTIPRLTGLLGLVVDGGVARIGRRALLLDIDEAQTLMQQLRGEEASSEETRAILESCEGWVAGFVLMALEGNPWERDPASPELADYFTQVVVARLEEDAREFLLATSILDPISAPDCDRLLGRTESGVMLEELVRRNLFIERLESEPPLYRYHRLFREYLDGELSRRDPAAVRDLHRLAGRIYLAQRDTVAAARHFISSGDYGRAASSLARISGKELAEASVTAAELLDLIPEHEIERHPKALLIRARLHYRAGEMDKCVDTAAKAFFLMQHSSDFVGMAEAEVLRATALKHRGETRLAVKACQRALKLLVGRGGHQSVQGEALLQLGTCWCLQGRLVQAVRILKQARDIWVKLGDLEREGISSEVLGTAYMHMGEPDRALAYYGRAHEAWAHLGYDLALNRLLLNTASLHLFRGGYEAASEVLESVFTALAVQPDARLEAIAWVNLAELKRDILFYDEALNHYAIGQAKARECLDTWLWVYAEEGRASVLRLRGRFQSARRLLRDVLHQAEELGGLALGLVLISLAAVNLEQQRYDESGAQVDRAIEILSTGRPSLELARAHWWRARLAYRIGEWEEARQALLQVAANLGQAYSLPLADLRGARRLLKHAVDLKTEPVIFARLLNEARVKYDHLAGRGGPFGIEEPGESHAPEVEMTSLGEAGVRIDGRLIPDSAWRSQKAKELFFFLAWNGKPMRRADIEAALWPDFHEAQAHTNFRVSVFRARRATFADALRYVGGRYEWNRSVGVKFDARDFVALTNSSRASPPGSDERIAALSKACALYGGPFLDGSYSDWCISVRNDLEARYPSALVEVADHLQSEGKFRETITWYEQAIEVDPLSEAAYEGLIRASIALRDQPMARHYYSRYRSTLHRELGEEPGDHLRRLISA